MKTLATYSDTEKARLLHQFFPNEIPAFLEFTLNLCRSIKEEQQQQREQWKNGLFTFDFWLQLVNQAEDNMLSSGNKLKTSSSHFAEQLFGRHLSVYTTYSLQLYTTTRQHPNPKFTAAIDLFFNP